MDIIKTNKQVEVNDKESNSILFGSDTDSNSVVRKEVSLKCYQFINLILF